jgi:putative transposase
MLPHTPMERVFRSLKTEWIPTMGYLTAQEAHRCISHCLMHRFDRTSSTMGWRRLRPRKKLNVVSEIS